MGITHLLDDFGPYLDGTPVSLTDVSLEEVRLEAFEKGYQAGWDDAVTAQREDTRCVSVQLSQSLQDMSFSYEEARADVLGSLAPLLKQMVGTVLPRLAQDKLPEMVAEELVQLMHEGDDQPIELRAAPLDMTALETLGINAGTKQVRLVEDDTLDSGQVSLRFGQTEREIDLNETLRKIDEAITGFFAEHQKETA